MSLKFGQIQPSSAELAAIERLKKSPHTYNGKNCVATFSQQLPFLIRPVSYLQVVMTHVSSDDFKNWEDPLLIWSILNLYVLRTCMISIYEGQLKITEPYLMTF